MVNGQVNLEETLCHCIILVASEGAEVGVCVFSIHHCTNINLVGSCIYHQ